VSNVFSGLEKNQFDIIFDTPYVLPAVKSLAYLKRKGKLVLTGIAGQHLVGMTYAKFTSKNITMVMVESRKEDLELIGKWLGDGFHIDLDSTFDIKDIENATGRNRDKTKKGRVVVKVENGWD